MENKIIKIDFENMTSEQLMEVQEKAKETRLNKAEDKIGELQDYCKKLNNSLEIVKLENEDLKEQVNLIQSETNQVTKTLLTHGRERRELENHLHHLIYKVINKDSIRDKLFHGDLTRLCKSEICKSLNVSAFTWIELDDLNVAKRIATKNLNKVSIHRFMGKRASTLLNKFDKLILKNKKLTDRENRQYDLLNELLEEVNGDENAI